MSAPAATQSALPLLRLLQVTDSSFPVGGFAFSHGLEWLVQAGWVQTEADIAAVVDGFIMQAGGGQYLPAALAAGRAGSLAAVLRVDDQLDAAIAIPGEREAGRIMGERLLSGASEAFPGERAEPMKAGQTAAFLAAVRADSTPGQYAAAFGLVAAECGVSERDMLAALGTTMITSVTQAAVRLSHIGPSAAIRIAANAGERLAAVIDDVLARPPARTFGAFTPGLDVAGLLHPTLPFRMFAS